MKSAAITEKKLNSYYCDALSVEECVNSLIYLTNKSRFARTTKANIEKQYYNSIIGKLLRRLDPVAFNCARSDM